MSHASTASHRQPPAWSFPRASATFFRHQWRLARQARFPGTGDLDSKDRTLAEQAWRLVRFAEGRSSALTERVDAALFIDRLLLRGPREMPDVPLDAVRLELQSDAKDDPLTFGQVLSWICPPWHAHSKWRSVGPSAGFNVRTTLAALAEDYRDGVPLDVRLRHLDGRRVRHACHYKARARPDHDGAPELFQRLVVLQIDGIAADRFL